MAGKKALVVYYSRTGTTKKVAEALAGALGADLEEIVDLKSRKGPSGFVVAGKDATLGRPTRIQEPVKDPGAYDLVVVGTPVWAWTMACAVRAYLTAEKARLPQVAFFLTTGGTGIERAFAHMQEVCGQPPVATLALKAGDVRAARFEEKVRDFAAALAG